MHLQSYGLITARWYYDDERFHPGARRFLMDLFYALFPAIVCGKTDGFHLIQAFQSAPKLPLYARQWPVDQLMRVIQIKMARTWSQVEAALRAIFDRFSIDF